MSGLLRDIQRRRSNLLQRFSGLPMLPSFLSDHFFQGDRMTTPKEKYILLYTPCWQELDEVTKYTEDDYYTVVEPVWRNDVTIITKCVSDSLELLEK